MAEHNVIIRYSMKDEVSPGIDNIGKKTAGLDSKVSKTQQGFNKMGSTNFSSMIGSLTRIGALVGAGLGFQQILSNTAEFQKYQAILDNMFGSQQGKMYFENLKKQAEILPASMGEITNSFIKLNGIGINPTNEEMTALSDLAAAAGKNILDSSEAMVGAATNQFERLKGLNIMTRVNGDKLTLMYKNQSTTIDNNSESIKDYLVSLGKSNGVAGASEKIMGTMGGVMSNIGDSFTNISVSIGEQLVPVMKKFANIISWISSKMPAIIKFFSDWGLILKPVLAGLAGFFILQKITVMVNAFKLAFAALTTTMNLNPFVLIVTAIVALGTALVVLKNKFGSWGELWSKTMDVIKTEWVSFTTTFGGAFKIIGNWLELIWLKVKNWFSKIGNYFGKLGDTISLLFQGKFKEAKDTFNTKSVGDYADEVIKKTEEVTNANNVLKDSIKNANTAAKNAKTTWINLAKGKNADGTVKVDPTDPNNVKPTTTTTNAPIVQGLTELSSSSNVKYVNISVNKMIESFSINTTNLTESNGKIKEEILQVLRATIADASSIKN